MAFVCFGTNDCRGDTPVVCKATECKLGMESAIGFCHTCGKLDLIGDDELLCTDAADRNVLGRFDPNMVPPCTGGPNYPKLEELKSKQVPSVCFAKVCPKGIESRIGLCHTCGQITKSQVSPDLYCTNAGDTEMLAIFETEMIPECGGDYNSTLEKELERNEHVLCKAETCPLSIPSSTGFCTTCGGAYRDGNDILCTSMFHHVVFKTYDANLVPDCPTLLTSAPSRAPSRAPSNGTPSNAPGTRSGIVSGLALLSILLVVR